MKLNTDCIRDILKYVESKNIHERIYFTNLVDNLIQYSEDDLFYSCIKLHEAKYLDVSVVSKLGKPLPSIGRIYGITFSGHEFLDNIKDDGIWSEVKDNAKNIGLGSLTMLAKIATEVALSKVKNYFLNT